SECSSLCPRRRRGHVRAGERVGADEPACKPDSVVPQRGTGGHPSRAAVAGSLVRPTRRLGRAALERLHRPSSTLWCSATLLALLRVGFAEPPEAPRAA